MNVYREYLPAPTVLLPAGGVWKADIRYNRDPVRAAEHTDDDSHIHSFCEIYVNVHGAVSFLVENNVYPVSEGDIIITKPNELHHCIYHSDIVHEHYCLWLAVNEAYRPMLDFIYDRKNGEGNRISMDPAARADLLSFLKTVWTEKENGTLQSASGLAALFGALDIIRRHRTQTGAPEKLPPDLLQLIQYIDENYNEDCSTSELEKRFYISRSTLNRRFRAYLNTSPARYVESRRMAAAKILLEKGESVQNTCMRCGFTDYSHFIAQFRRRFGITPFQYAKKNIGK